MSDSSSKSAIVNRREFVRAAVGAGAALQAGVALSAGGSRIIGANERINVGFVGVGGRGMSLLREALRFQESSNSIQIVAVCDVYEKRKRAAAQISKGEGCLDYRELLNRNDVDAVFVAT